MRDLLATDLDEHQVKLLAELLASMSTMSSGHGGQSTGHVHTSTTECAVERRRKQWRESKRRKRLEAELLGKQTMSEPVAASTECPQTVHRTGLSEPVDSNNIFSLTEFQGSKELVVEGRKRGSRLSETWQLPSDDREFARGFGFTDREIDQLRAEFVDYWIAVPGQRGTKLNWSATWRNRVREVAGRKGHRNGGRKQGPGALAELALELADEAKQLELARGIGRTDGPFGSS